MSDPLLGPHDLSLLRAALDRYTVDAVHETLGLAGQAALQRGDLAGVARQLGADDPLETLVRMFLLGRPVAETAARTALHPLPLERATAAGLLVAHAGVVRALLDIRPYAQLDGAATPWWVVSDFGADVRPGPLPTGHVLGIGAAALTLAQATPRRPVARALDIGTGCGVQALHLGRHAGEVVATDISPRALQLAATSAALSGQQWDLRQGSLLEPVHGERYDLVVSNPPFVISPGGAGYDYRDSGLPGDAVCAALVRGLPHVLADGGTAQLLANWVIPADVAWTERLHAWLAGSGCDAWVWQREIAEPAEYVALWLRDAGETPGTARWTRRYDRWLDWFAGNGVIAVGMGLITMWRTASSDPVVVLEDVPQPLEQPVAEAMPGWLARHRWLAGRSAAALLDATLIAAPGLERERTERLGPTGWFGGDDRLRQTSGMRWAVETDEALAALIAGCDGNSALRTPTALLAAALDRPVADVAEAVLPVVRDLVGRGFLIPAELQ